MLKPYSNLVKELKNLRLACTWHSQWWAYGDSYSLCYPSLKESPKFAASIKMESYSTQIQRCKESTQISSQIRSNSAYSANALFSSSYSHLHWACLYRLVCSISIHRTRSSGWGAVINVWTRLRISDNGSKKGIWMICKLQSGDMWYAYSAPSWLFRLISYSLFGDWTRAT